MATPLSLSLSLPLSVEVNGEHTSKHHHHQSFDTFGSIGCLSNIVIQSPLLSVVVE